MTTQCRQSRISRAVASLLDMDFGAKQNADVAVAGTIVTESRSKNQTAVTCGECKEITTYPVLFTKGFRGSLRLQTCPECNVRYFKEDEVVL
jgi:hypothetical protein